MREPARLLLEGTLDRRAFVSRLTAMGVAGGAARDLARSLSAGARGPAREDGRAAVPSRVVRDLTGGELAAELLLEWNVPYVFGLGGSEEIGFLDALVDRLPLHYVQALHEASVMAMADGYARASGETAFVNLHSIAGAGYALAPMVNAFKDRTPVVVTVGRQSTALRGTNAFLEAVNLHQLPRDYARWTWDVLGAVTIPNALRRAFLLAEAPPGGPTFVTVSKDLWEERVTEAEILPRSRSRLDAALAPNEAQVSRIADVLVEAELPVLVAGREVGRHGGAAALMEIAELLGAPLFMDVEASHTPAVVPVGHPMYAGLFGEDPAAFPAFDAFWSAGGTMFGLGTPPPEPLVPRSARAIHTSVDGTEVARNYPVDVGVLANVGLTAAAVLEELRGRALPRGSIEERRRTVRRYHDERSRRLEDAARAAWDRRPIASERLAEELNRRLDPDAIVVSELVTSEPFLKAYLELWPHPGDGPPSGSGGVRRRPGAERDAGPDRTGRRNLTSRGGVLGWGVAAAIGAKIARPDRQVVALVGDGSFHFGVQALWSAARYEVPVAVVIWNNGGYQANRRFLHAYGGRAAATGKYVGASLAAPDIDSVSLARGYGVDGERVEDPAALSAALERCLRAADGGQPYVLDVEIERRWGGADSSWYDFFSVARKQSRKS